MISWDTRVACTFSIVTPAVSLTTAVTLMTTEAKGSLPEVKVSRFQGFIEFVAPELMNKYMSSTNK